MVKQFLPTLIRIPRSLLVGMLKGYQATLSPDHGPLKYLYPYGFCRHEPTCSEYAKRGIDERGALKGSLMSFKRILTCNPWKKPSERKIRSLLGIPTQDRSLL
ncbi:MAG: membrane protein insertion efficiency factor YidD [Patescibacteria group bacterium]